MSTITDVTEATGAEKHRARILQQITAVRALCDLAERHVDVFPDYVLARDFAITVDSAAEMTRLATALGGRWEKRTYGDWFSLERDFGGSDEWSRVKLSINTNRMNVCERVQTGTETRRVPDPQLVAEIPLVTIEEPVYERRCPDSLLDIRDEDFTGPATAERDEAIPW